MGLRYDSVVFLEGGSFNVQNYGYGTVSKMIQPNLNSEKDGSSIASAESSSPLVAIIVSLIGAAIVISLLAAAAHAWYITLIFSAHLIRD